MGLELEPGRPVQLVRLDEEGDLTLDREALSLCLEQGGVGDAPVCLVSVIGEQRLGKSFLLNYLLRRLQHPDARDGSWMGREDEPLEGFEWRRDEQQVTKGLWACSQPFWVPAEGRQVAVLLVDTEGSMDLERNKETSIKLSAMSMLLSSYQILNIGRRVKDPDLEYLEMFLHVAEVVGKAYGLEPVQHLDLLVRDWSSSPDLGAQGGAQYLRKVKEMLAATSPCKHPKALKVLSRSSSRCYLMPPPVKQIMMGSEGRLKDMDEDFRESLKDYITTLVGSAGQHVRRDQHGKLLTGTQLAAKIKNLSDVMKKHRSGFSSPCQMAITFHNQGVMDNARKDHAVFLKEKDGLSRRIVDCLKVDPSAMAEQLVEQLRSLLGRCQKEMKEPEETLLTALKEELTREAETFLETYTRRYECHTINQRVMHRARQDYAAFLKKTDMFTSAEELVAQCRQLLEQCRKEMMPKTESPLNAELMQEKEARLRELEAELMRTAESFKVANEKHKTMVRRMIYAAAAVVAAAGAGIVAAAGAGVVTAAGAGVVAATGAGVVAAAGLGLVTAAVRLVAAGARVIIVAGAGLVAAVAAGVIAALGAGVTTATHAGLIIAVGVGVIIAVRAIFIKYN